MASEALAAVAPRRPSRRLVVATFALLCMIWGTTWAAIRVSLEGIPPLTGVALRFGIAAAVLGALVWRSGLRLGQTRIERRLWWANAVLSFGVPYVAVYWGEQWVPSGLAAVLFAPYPLIVAILAHFALPAESMRPRDLLGTLIGCVGVGVIFSEDLSALGGPGVAMGALVLLLSPFASALGSVATKKWGAGIHPLSITAVPMALTSIGVGVAAFFRERALPASYDASSIAALLYLALMGSAVTFSLYYWLLAHVAARRLALIAYVVPVVAVTLGALIGEPITGRILLGAAMVVLGVGLAVGRRA